MLELFLFHHVWSEPVDGLQHRAAAFTTCVSPPITTGQQAACFGRWGSNPLHPELLDPHPRGGGSSQPPSANPCRPLPGKERGWGIGGLGGNALVGSPAVNRGRQRLGGCAARHGRPQQPDHPLRPLQPIHRGPPPSVQRGGGVLGAVRGHVPSVLSCPLVAQSAKTSAEACRTGFACARGGG